MIIRQVIFGNWQITGIHSDGESDSNTSDEQNLFNVSSLFLKHKPAIECDKELQLLNQWYRQDENFVSSIYKLQPIRLVLSSFSALNRNFCSEVLW